MPLDSYLLSFSCICRISKKEFVCDLGDKRGLLLESKVDFNTWLGCLSWSSKEMANGYGRPSWGML
jgi:hypothetical protein